MSLSIGGPIVPKEHGAWAVLYGAFLTGIGVAGKMTIPAVLFLVGITAGAFANGPLAILARWPAVQVSAERRRQAIAWLLVYGAVAAAALALLVLVYRMIFLVPFGIGAAFFLGLRAYLVKERDDRTLAGELVGTAGLTMVGAASHAVAVGKVQAIAGVLWLILFLYFSSGVFYVRARVHGMLAQRRRAASPSNSALRPCLFYHALLVVALPILVLVDLVPWPVLLAFAPALWRAAVGLRREEARLDLRRLGWSEVAVATAFVLLVIGAFRFTPLAG